jgi:crossover junction endodeoxyribonuclease RuvC
MIVLGIDPGIERTGYAFIDDSGGQLKALSYGLISTSKTLPKVVRLKQIHDDLTTLLSRFRADLLAIESLIFAKNVTTALTVSEARGVILLAGIQAGLDTEEFSPVQVKKSLTGYGKSDKVQMERAVQIVLGLTEIPKPDDVCDAIAIAICGANHAASQARVRASQGAGGADGRFG